MSSYLALLRWGYSRPVARTGALLPHRFTLTMRGMRCAWRFDFCGTFLEVAFTGRYPAPCPAELGLSSGGQASARDHSDYLSLFTTHANTMPAMTSTAHGPEKVFVRIRIHAHISTWPTHQCPDF